MGFVVNINQPCRSKVRGSSRFCGLCSRDLRDFLADSTPDSRVERLYISHPSHSQCFVMPVLQRTKRKLLTVVGGKPHATQDDYVDTLPTPPNSNSTRSAGSNAIATAAEDDVNRDPESSGDEKKHVGQRDGRKESKTFRQPDQRLKRSHAIPAAPIFKQPGAGSPASLESKQSNGSDGPSSDAEDEIFGSQQKKRRSNIHALPKPRHKQQMYGKGTKTQLPKRDDAAKFKKPTKSNAEDTASAPVFRQAKGADMMFRFRGADPVAEFQAPQSSGNLRNSLSPSLSSLSSAPSSPDVEEIAALDLPDARPHVSKSDCKICGRGVDKLLKEEFENEQYLMPGKRLSHKWQKRFCRYHRQREAEDLWNERGYPKIDWDGLEDRMLRLHPHLEGVMNGTKSSFYREELVNRLKGRAKTAVQAWRSENVKEGAPVGYYGPRGEKEM
jgi:hypothetical protein